MFSTSKKFRKYLLANKLSSLVCWHQRFFQRSEFQVLSLVISTKIVYIPNFVKHSNDEDDDGGGVGIVRFIDQTFSNEHETNKSSQCVCDVHLDWLN